MTKYFSSKNTHLETHDREQSEVISKNQEKLQKTITSTLPAIKESEKSRNISGSGKHRTLNIQGLGGTKIKVNKKLRFKKNSEFKLKKKPKLSSLRTIKFNEMFHGPSQHISLESNVLEEPIGGAQPIFEITDEEIDRLQSGELTNDQIDNFIRLGNFFNESDPTNSNRNISFTTDQFSQKHGGLQGHINEVIGERNTDARQNQFGFIISLNWNHYVALHITIDPSSGQIQSYSYANSIENYDDQGLITNSPLPESLSFLENEGYQRIPFAQTHQDQEDYNNNNCGIYSMIALRAMFEGKDRANVDITEVLNIRAEINKISKDGIVEDKGYGDGSGRTQNLQFSKFRKFKSDNKLTGVNYRENQYKGSKDGHKVYSKNKKIFSRLDKDDDDQQDGVSRVPMMMINFEEEN